MAKLGIKVKRESTSPHYALQSYIPLFNRMTYFNTIQLQKNGGNITSSSFKEKMDMNYAYADYIEKKDSSNESRWLERS